MDVYKKGAGGVRTHVLNATKAYGGKLPRGAIVHHMDCDKTNNDNTNLVVCPNQEYHKFLHMRTEVVNRNGNPNTHKWCPVCSTVQPFSSFGNRAGDKLYSKCKSCVSVTNRTAYHRSKIV